MLNELETSYWQLVNKTTDIEKVELHNFLERLMMTALYAKRYTCPPSEILIYEAFLSHNYPQLMNSYCAWIQTKAISEKSFDLKSVNEQFKALFGEIINEADTEVDYNFIVDYIFSNFYFLHFFHIFNSIYL